MSGLIDLDAVAGARSTHKFARLSASKARVVLDLIRDDDLQQAREELQFCDRGAAAVVSKVLESAVSNAENNENLSADELYVAECWADEGPTLKRWRPRARGRATRINKRTCHITVVVAQLSEDELEMRAASLAASGRRSADQDRAARVAASRDTEEETEAVAEELVEEDSDTPDSSVEAEVVSEEAESPDSEPEIGEEIETDAAELESTEDTEPTDEDEKES
ncbi:MAG: 50S ribosomal protein L22 [Acidimicrobiales bacterium MED-G01]|nr:MAG: 50S ribosomal protein L22 [Acidimicrobiales bacterium MED-G01]|tara:strand:+ start:1011 stop:1679 length:669 start_codon:yes stop_codon:yes gene_type:complete